MDADDLLFRLRRIYAAINVNVEHDLSRVPAIVIVRPDLVAVSQDFRGGMTIEEIHNAAHMVISVICSLRDHLRKWASANGRDEKIVWDAFNASRPLQVIQDLANNEKHGYPPKDGRGNSGDAPMLQDVDRLLRLGTGTPNRWSGVFWGPRGLQRFGDGTSMVVITGAVVDRDGKAIGGLYEMELEAVAAWEKLLTELGVMIPNTEPIMPGQGA